MEVAAAFERLLAAHEGAGLWDAIGEAGYFDALAPEGGLSLADVEPLLRALGRHAIDLPVAETMAARALAAPSRELCAVMAAAEIAGGGERLVEMSLAHAGTRKQFGKPLAAFQAIQQQLAVLAEQVVLVRIAAQAGCAAGLTPPVAIAAMAKHVASAAVPVMTGIAHAVHGAIGITQEFPLHRVTGRLHALRSAHGSESYWAERLGEARLANNARDSLAFIRDTVSAT
jgi:acyl-CoA dehydrogenase